MNKKKVAIVTFYSNFNYGAILQCYALQECVRDENIGGGYDIEVLDFKRGVFRRVDSPFYISGLSCKAFINMIRYLPRNIGKAYKKKQFVKHYCKMSRKFTESRLPETNNYYDCFIAGSDQIWNYNLTKSVDIYLLNFVGDYARKISYAASFGLKEIDKQYCKSYRESINRFDYLSVREESGVRIIKELGVNKDVEVVVDPVFLLTEEHWRSITKTHTTQNYILLYSFRSNGATRCAVDLAKKTGKKLIVLSGNVGFERKCKKINILGPVEWITWIANADYVITDSFHATAFSIIFKRNFASFRDTGKTSADSRLETLLSKLDLQERLFTDEADDDIICADISYEKVSQKLSTMVMESKKFLKNALKEND